MQNDLFDKAKKPRNPEQEFYDTLCRLLNAPVNLTFTNNRRRMISVRREDDLYVIRLHYHFIRASNGVIKVLARWMPNTKEKPPAVVMDFVNAINKAVASGKTTPPMDRSSPAKPHAEKPLPNQLHLRTSGEVHDLMRIAEKVNERFFDGRINSRITWGRDTSRQKVRTRRLGAYYRDDDLIIIHPVLDHPYVPEAIVAFTIFHEMLHARQPPDRRPHDSEFKRAERQHPDYKFVKKWREDYSSLISEGRWKQR